MSSSNNAPYKGSATNRPLNLLFDLPDEIIRLVYSFDSTYHEILDTLIVELRDPCPHGRLAKRCREPLCVSNLFTDADGYSYYHLVVIEEVSSREFAAASRQ